MPEETKNTINIPIKPGMRTGRGVTKVESSILSLGPRDSRQRGRGGERGRNTMSPEGTGGDKPHKSGRERRGDRGVRRKKGGHSSAQREQNPGKGMGGREGGGGIINEGPHLPTNSIPSKGVHQYLPVKNNTTQRGKRPQGTSNRWRGRGREAPKQNFSQSKELMKERMNQWTRRTQVLY